MLFNAADILNFAIRIEANGENLYRQASSASDEGEIKEVLLELARQEAEHRRFFEDMVEKRENPFGAESLGDEYVRYVMDYIDGRIVFSREKKERLLATKDVIGLIEFALEVERDSILFYQGLRGAVAQRYLGQLEAIVEEEKRHFALLSQRRKGLQR